MKRNLSMLLAGLLVLVMASPLYAAPDIKVNGQIRTRLRYWVNIDLDNDAKNGPDSGGSNADRRYFDNRTRFGVDAKLSDGVRAVIQLEKYFDFGNVGPAGGRSGSVGTGSLSTIGGTEQEPYIRQAWIDFVIPGLQEEGIRFQAGRSFFRVGHGFLWGNSLTGEDGFTLYGPLGPGNFKIRWAMTQNQSSVQGGRQRMFDNETSHWAVDYKFDVAEKQNVEIYFLGQNDKGVDSYTGGGAGGLGNVTLSGLAGAPVRHSNEYFFGAAYTGVAGPVALRAEGSYAFGEARRNVAFNAAGPCTLGAGSINPSGAGVLACTREDNISRQAFFMFAEATYKIIPAWNVGIAMSVASGDDNPADDKAENFVGPLAEFTTSPTRVWTDSQFFHGNRSGRRLGNGGITAAGVSSGTNRAFNFWGRGTEDIDASFSVGDNGTIYSPGLFELQFKTKYTFNKEVTANANIIPTWAMNHPDGSGRYMGTEIDAKVAYKPYQNLLINTYIGYFVAGGFFDQGGLLSASTISNGLTPTNDDAWMFRTEAIVTF